ncbi:MAG: rod shape-determining protein MreC [Candidatus Kerfeldbacteria bacterium RIFCSPHIGHO2_02_FULL_42_14]|uniref:Cell shape-determining protein MreC n=1 Tax=Candidatus Kerfeldbacteria bacterium RIFCSPHIGHO2_02_FULL_42_14 TaxID=1798540 RepID=A0A1G2AQ38_9BACT|nr:MAG: rod shape-determining protein MreC [Candidatus Kerfeldbacteria bacterium RIFCSPHIGHO2_02_FULL_42_14]OGY80655.1 MAG: rod shape-determining protein MreC [Candidatus Kerfeldbacteria bacterium RIFCSPHIGHO2_12_FULL_42_13]OGY82580.1 MAG: rod shape-determining protein MreC [Candidatus Kerfeldbacteria bacterium RIFCSPLOWO2_02_FULL_42_19]OGY85183.1 MAG: rod shape-determining protein MreC [Candidatus Kerfeldbacteria bacterium RIFCSPLOWO2_12_FULL_43_9]
MNVFSRRISLFIIGSFLLLIFIFFGVFRFAENVLTFIAAPVQQVFWQMNVRLKNIAAVLRQDSVSLQQENIRLKNQLNASIMENAKLHQKIVEFESLSEQLKYIDAQGLRSIPMNVLGPSSDGIAQVIHVSKGAQDGVQVGLPVIVDNGLFVGKIIDVTTTTAQVLLITDNNSAFSAVVQNDAQSPGIVSGQHGLSLKMDFIPQLDPIAIDMIVITAGSEPLIPKGLVVGIIESVSKPSGALFQQADVRSLVNLQKLEVVSAVLRQ